jgi:molybdopterin converting factor small subunit/chorismate mutase
MPTIHIPTPLRPYVDKQESVEVAGRTVREALANLTSTYGDLRKHLYNDEGKLRSFVNIYLNDEDIRYLQKEDTALQASDALSIIPSVAGGAPGATAAERELPTLSAQEYQRYSRHLILPEVGLEGQRKLKAARVLCVGAGGLGSPVALYLAAAGVGTIGIVDFDVVDLSNLQRQIIHTTADIGRPKLESAKAKINAMNPEVNVLTYPRNLEGSITILGEKGSVKIGGTAVNKVEHWLFAEYDDDDKLVDSANTNPPTVYGFGHEGYYRNVLAVLRGEAKPDTDGRAGRKSLELILGIYEPTREATVMAHVKTVNASLEGPLTDDAIERLYERIMDEARRIQRLDGERQTERAKTES